MKKSAVKYTICAILVIICLSATAFALTACDKDTLRPDYAAAQANWYAADNKVVYDSLSVDGDIGKDIDWPVIVTLDGYRAYIGDEWKMDYDISVGIALGEGRTPLTLKGTLDVARSADANVSIGLNLTYFNISLINLNLSIAESAIRDYVPTFDFADNVFYDVSVIGGTADNFTIAGELSLAYVFYQLAPVLSNNFNFDMMPMLEKWLSLGDVSGSVTFSGGNFATMTTAQHISVFAPQEDLDFLAYNVDNFPDMLINFFESKKLTVPILGDIDFNKPFADGIRLSADITSSASYKILSADVTFDSVKEDYENSRTDEQLD